MARLLQAARFTLITVLLGITLASCGGGPTGPVAATPVTTPTVQPFPIESPVPTP